MSHPFSSATLQTLKDRAMVIAAVRRFFEEHGYWEVSTPLLSHDICVDQWLEPFTVSINGLTDERGQIGYLQTSPEFAMKRLLCGGADAIYEITKSFRRDELGDRHNPEFTILEWYRRDDDHHAQMDFVESLIKEVSTLKVCSSSRSFANSPFRRLTYREAFGRYANCDPLLDSITQLQQIARLNGVDVELLYDRDQILNQLLAEIVEPKLATIPALFLYDYPASQAALSIVRDEEPAVAERFELYLSGLEICNGYHELTDAHALRQRMRDQNQKRVTTGHDELPVESRLLEAMQIGMPRCSGVALGLDRLVMHCLGKTKISEVIAFPIDRA